MIRFDLSFNNIKNGGAVLFSRGLSVDENIFFLIYSYMINDKNKIIINIKKTDKLVST